MKKAKCDKFSELPVGFIESKKCHDIFLKMRLIVNIIADKC